MNPRVNSKVWRERRKEFEKLAEEERKSGCRPLSAVSKVTGETIQNVIQSSADFCGRLEAEAREWEEKQTKQ